MGEACFILNWLYSFQISDWINIAAIIVNSFLAFWIVRTIQNRLTNKRVLKDHFINEIKEIRSEYRNCLNRLHSNKAIAKSILPWFKLMNIKVNDLMDILNKKYKLEKDLLLPYQRDLQELVTNNEDFIRYFKTTEPVQFSEQSKIQFIKFQQDHNQIFTNIIVKINDSQ